jgi:hypothetical protein
MGGKQEGHTLSTLGLLAQIRAPSASLHGASIASKKWFHCHIPMRITC